MNDQVRALPTDSRITHDLELTDGVTSLGLILCNSRGVPIQSGNPWSFRQSGSLRTSLQIRQGDADYSDYQLPYTPFTQKDWSGGRGNEDFEKDKTRYSDSNSLDTRMGDIILAGKVTEVPLISSPIVIEPIINDISMKQTATSNMRFASKHIPSSSFMFTNINLRVSPNSICKIEIIKDAAGVPSAAPADMVASALYTPPAPIISSSNAGADVGRAPLGLNELGRGINVPSATETILVSIPISGSIVYGTTYWVVITSSAIGYNTLAGGVVKKETTPGTWVDFSTADNVYFKLTAINQGIVQLFNYKGALYAVVKRDSGATSQLFLNGFRGVAGAGSTQSVIVAPSGWFFNTNELTGCRILVVGGKCYDEVPNFRKIVSNTSNTIQLDAGFLNTPDNTTEFVILGRDLWSEIPNTGFAGSVINILVANEMVYFAQGENTVIRKMREYNNAGVWTREFADEGTSKASFLRLLPAHTGKIQIWKFNNPVTGCPLAAYATPTAWGTPLDFTTKPTELATTTDYPIKIGDARSKITNVVGYGEPMIPYVLKEDEFGSIADGVYATVPISELGQVRSATNGAAAIQFGVYLFFTVLDGLERFYQNRLDDVGPNRDEGFPAGRTGQISCIVSYPGGLYLGIDATAAGTSSVLYWNQIGYHEVYRAPMGQRIRSMFVQVIPGTAVSRLWIGLSTTTVWIPVTLNPRQQPEYRYTSSGTLTSAWFNGGFKEINKFWRSIQVYAENLSSGQWIGMEYQTDMDADFVALPDIYDTSPMKEVLMTQNFSAYGKRWRYRITLHTNDPAKTPRVKAITAPTITRLPPNKAWSLTVVADDALVDRQGTLQTLGAAGLISQLEKWADSETNPLPLIMHSPIAAFDNRRVFIEPPVAQPVEVENAAEVKTLKAIITLSMYEA
ncbi:MAG: hypothetical protein WAW52_01775 [Methanothrix sp.]